MDLLPLLDENDVIFTFVRDFSRGNRLAVGSRLTHIPRARIHTKQVQRVAGLARATDNETIKLFGDIWTCVAALLDQ